MQKEKKILITVIVLIVGGVLTWSLLGSGKVSSLKNNQNPTPTVLSDKLQIISTNPNPLEEATILPTQYIEITFNKPLFVSEFKHRFDPEIDHEVKVINGRDYAFGSTFRIIFKKPLELGGGYTLFILSTTKTEEGLGLPNDLIFHFQTIPYKGV